MNEPNPVLPNDLLPVFGGPPAKPPAPKPAAKPPAVMPELKADAGDKPVSLAPAKKPRGAFRRALLKGGVGLTLAGGGYDVWRVYGHPPAAALKIVAAAQAPDEPKPTSKVPSSDERGDDTTPDLKTRTPDKTTPFAPISPLAGSPTIPAPTIPNTPTPSIPAPTIPGASIPPPALSVTSPQVAVVIPEPTMPPLSIAPAAKPTAPAPLPAIIQAAAEVPVVPAAPALPTLPAPGAPLPGDQPKGPEVVPSVNPILTPPASPAFNLNPTAPAAPLPAAGSPTAPAVVTPSPTVAPITPVSPVEPQPAPQLPNPVIGTPQPTERLPVTPPPQPATAVASPGGSPPAMLIARPTDPTVAPRPELAAPAIGVAPATAPSAAARGGESARTDFDVDIHEPKAGESYESISRQHYNDPKYADALRAFNQNRPVGGTPIMVPPMYVLRQRYRDQIGAPRSTGVAPPSVPASRSRDRSDNQGLEWGPATGTGRAEGETRSTYTVRQGGKTLWDVAEDVYGDRRQAKRLRDANPDIDPNADLPAGTKLRLPSDS